MKKEEVESDDKTEEVVINKPTYPSELSISQSIASAGKNMDFDHVDRRMSSIEEQHSESKGDKLPKRRKSISTEDQEIRIS